MRCGFLALAISSIGALLGEETSPLGTVYGPKAIRTLPQPTIAFYGDRWTRYLDQIGPTISPTGATVNVEQSAVNAQPPKKSGRAEIFD